MSCFLEQEIIKTNKKKAMYKELNSLMSFLTYFDGLITAEKNCLRQLVDLFVMMLVKLVVAFLGPFLGPFGCLVITALLVVLSSMYFMHFCFTHFQV